MGSMESQKDSLISDRMENRDMRWTIKGALRMAKAIQLRENGQLEKWCGRNSLSEKTIIKHES